MIKLVAFGDSLTAGFGVAPGQAFPEVLQRVLRARGHDVEVINAGVSGETAEDGLERFDWSVPAGTDAMIMELGANDMLQGKPPGGAKAALSTMLAKAKAAKVATLLTGMKAAPILAPRTRSPSTRSSPISQRNTTSISTRSSSKPSPPTQS